MIPWYLLKLYAQRHSKFTKICIGLLIMNLIFLNRTHVFLIFWSFLVGMAVSYSFVSPTSLVPNFLPMFSRRRRRASIDYEEELSLLKSVCTVCGLRKCPRHRPELNILAFQPWTHLTIHQTIDTALDEFFSIVLKDYVYTWYRELSEDEGFVDELRTNFRFLASVMFRRLKKVDIPHFATKKVVKVVMQHIDLCKQAYMRVNHGDLQQIVLDQLGPTGVHCAMYSRKSELEYLRRLVESLFPYILRPQALNSKSTCALVREILAGSILMPLMDSLANPDLVNNLLLIFFDDTPPPIATDPPSPMVPFLGNFSQSRAQNQSNLRLKLKDVINPENQELLYPFMQFLKSEAAVNVLQFCMDCEDFNRRILSPDVSQSEFGALHAAAKDLYRSYVDPAAIDRIKFDDDVVDTLRDIVNGPADQIIRLRTSTPLFKAYEHAYDLLENNFLPLFHQSDDYYNMICGGRPSSLVRQMSRLPKKRDFTLAQFGSKLKDVFKSSEEKLANSLEAGIDGLLLNSLPASVSIEEELAEEEAESTDDHSLHDLSSWRVTIPRIGARPDPENHKKQYFVFIIDVRRLDIREGDSGKWQWTVARRYPEFYVLEQKLTEFHGQLTECQLPAKKSFGTKNQDFTEGKRPDFENYLQKLLTKPQLKNSELLYKFLTSEHEFSTSFLPDIKLGKFVKSKLVKEKGQHLDEFLVSFGTSTEAPKPRPSKPPRRGSEASLLSTSSEKLTNSHFENNMNQPFNPNPGPSKDNSTFEIIELDGIFDAIVYIVKQIFEAPPWMYQLVLSGRIVFKETLEAGMENLLDSKLASIKQEHRIVTLVHLLRDTLFFDEDPPRTDEAKKLRYMQTLEELIDFIPGLVTSSLGQTNIRRGSEFLLNLFQQPKLNKQLTYLLLDLVVVELFPELARDPQSGGLEET